MEYWGRHIDFVFGGGVSTVFSSTRAWATYRGNRLVSSAAGRTEGTRVRKGVESYLLRRR